MSAFLVDGKMITDKNDIRGMWAEHFEKLDTLSTNTNFDSTFLDRVSASVQEFVTSYKYDPFGDFKGQLQMFYKLTSYERAFRMLKNDMCVTEIGQAVLEL